VLGFDTPIDTLSLSTVTVNETKLTSNYTANNADMFVMGGTGVQAGDCLMITNGTTTDYFTALAGTTDTHLIVATSATNNYVGVANSYTVSGTRLQILREQDPNNEPTLWYSNIDQLARFGIKTIVNQIDFSSTI